MKMLISTKLEVFENALQPIMHECVTVVIIWSSVPRIERK